MNKRTVSNKVLLYFLMLMFLTVVVGCGSSGGGSGIVPVGNATITGTVSGTTVVAIDNGTNVVVDREVATGTPKTFTLTVPNGKTYSFFLIENENTLDQQIYPLYVGATNAFYINTLTTINLGFVDTTTIAGMATPANNPLSVTGVSSAGANTNFPDTVFVTTPTAGASLSELVASGLTSLQSGNILQANAYFNAAVTNYPNDTTSNGNIANFFYAVTSVADVDLYSDGNPSNLDSVGDFLDNAGCSKGGRGFSNSTMTCPKILPSTTTPTGSQMQTFLYSVIMQKLQTALTYLNKVPSTFAITWTNPIDSTPYTSDYADVLVYKASIEAALAAINIQYAYNLDANIATVHNSNWTVQQFLSTYTSFLALNPSSSSYLSTAKAYLSPTTGNDDPFDNLKAAIDKIQARSTSLSYLINLPTDLTTAQITAVKTGLSQAKLSLSGQATIYDNGTPTTTDDYIINLSNFFAGINLRSPILLPPITGNNVSGLFPDKTMGGVIVQAGSSPNGINTDTNSNNIPDILEH